MNLPSSVLPLDRRQFEAIREEEFRPSYDLPGLKHLRDKAKNERDLRELYRNRAPYELLQNADDAQATSAAFVLLPDGLAFVHNGRWFTVGNFRSLADGWSDKNPDECIGHKGLGFRAVLDITPTPHLVQLTGQEWLAIKFSYGLNKEHIIEAIRRKPDLRAHYDDWGKHGQICCPVMAIPGTASKKSLGGVQFLIDDLRVGKFCPKATTLFWFPAKDSSIEKDALEELDCMPLTADTGKALLLEFAVREARVLLPFLNHLKTLSIFDGRCRIGCVQLEAHDGQLNRRISVKADAPTQSQPPVSYFRMRFEIPIPPEVAKAPGTPKAVKSMATAKAALLIPIVHDRPVPSEPALMHVYFPTSEHTGLGCVVHGDFYVTPDRRHLMPGKYNEWLLSFIAEKLANEFLSELLRSFPAGSVFAALAPVEKPLTDVTRHFIQSVRGALKNRQQPFIPAVNTVLSADAVALGPTINSVWESHLGDETREWAGRPFRFVSHAADGLSQRRFLDLAGVQVLPLEAVLTLMRDASRTPRPATWWYDCISHLARGDRFGILDRSRFPNNAVIPLDDGSLHTISDGDRRLVCLPADEAELPLQVPRLFAPVFSFLEAGLARLLYGGDVEVMDWFVDRYRVIRFEVTDLIPRAIRATVQRLFSGEVQITATDLAEVWSFVRKAGQELRQITDQKFWDEIGRLPLPSVGANASDPIPPGSLVPAFLAFWPEPLCNSRALDGVLADRRVSQTFLEALHTLTNEAITWRRLLNAVGVAENPVVRRYRRVAVGGQDLLLCHSRSETWKSGYSGERQLDETRVIVVALSTDPWWHEFERRIEPCIHDAAKVLQSLEFVDGLNVCSQMAEKEYANGKSGWAERLRDCIQGIGAEAGEHADSVLCRGGSATGHVVSAPSYSRMQIRGCRFVPTSRGPRSIAESFARLLSQRLISSGPSNEEIGDFLLPYVVADSYDQLSKYERLGIEVLQDADSASPECLLRALGSLSGVLETEWGQSEIIAIKSRWRLVRGAIQQMYRALNRTLADDRIDGPKLAAKVSGKIGFYPVPLYYATPGSLIDRAFQGILPMIDADRVYERFFASVGVTQLIPGQAISESLHTLDVREGGDLRKEICDGLGPFLVAPIIASGRRSSEIETIARRLRDRFAVLACKLIDVTFSLNSGSSQVRTVSESKFYMRRTLVPRTGGGVENQFTLYVVTDQEPHIGLLDADALGETLVPLFTDDTVGDWAALFPRIVTRYQAVGGDTALMREFLLNQLHVSLEAQEEACWLVSDEELKSEPPSPPPPALLITAAPPLAGSGADEQHTLEGQLQRQESQVREKAASLIRGLSTPNRDRAEGRTNANGEHHIHYGVTREQQDRGREGEEEIKRRLTAAGGWEEFTFVSDMRDQACGYDFLCRCGGREVKIEVKTFLLDGRVVVTSNELRESAASRQDYYLVGVLHDGPASSWATVIRQDPLSFLMTHGEFTIEVSLEMKAQFLWTTEKS